MRIETKTGAEMSRKRQTRNGKAFRKIVGIKFARKRRENRRQAALEKEKRLLTESN
jgi:hypothetical protein